MEYSRPDMPIVIAGTKSDEDDDAREVTEEEAEELIVQDWDNVYLECSAKLGRNVKNIFQKLVQIAYDEESEVKLILDPPQDSRKFGRRRSMQVGGLHQHPSLAAQLSSPKRFYRRKSKSLQFEPADFNDVVQNKRKESLIQKILRKTD